MNPEYLEITVEVVGTVGGQQAGSPSLGVWVKHKPTGIRAFCDANRSQIRNKKTAMAMVEYGLAELGWEEA